MKNEKGIIKISVRALVEFILREGDIDNRHGRGFSSEAMQEGSRIHRKIQRGMGDDYHAEVPLRITIEEEDYQLIVEGRADGICTLDEGTGAVMVDEIKGVYQNLEFLDAPVHVHRAQAMCYAYIYALKQELDEIDVQLTYCNLDTEELKYFREHFSFSELKEWFADLIGAYKKWADFQFAWRQLRQESIRRLAFPFPYRAGQKELAAGVYRTILRGKNLFIQAPTGVGKTISTVFPAVKAVGEGLGERIFYLTAKTVTGTVAKEAFELLRAQGYQGKVILITAKEKLCLCGEMDCNPVHCPYAKGHFDRVNDAVFNLLQKEDVFTREVLLEQAKEYCVCPFEMCLDVATWVDDIICDYNYVFDPNVYLKRFFAEGVPGDYIFLVDEAHNLVERSREMYSATLYKEDFLTVKKAMKQYSTKVASGLDRCNRLLLGYKRECEKYMLYDGIGSLSLALMRLASDMDEFLQQATEFPERKEVTEFYLNLRKFMNTYELVDDHYMIYSEHEEDGRFKLKLYCVDPSGRLQERIDKGNATIFFSATLLPISYYKKLLSTKTDNYAVYAETAFSQDQRLLLLGSDVSSRYKRRTPEEFARIAMYVRRVARARKGNYMVFFPSYKMMQQVYEVFCEQEAPGEEPEGSGLSVEVRVQQTGMREAEREEFLAAFSEESLADREGSLVAFCVLGGIFGEGIDLKNEQLIGVIVVGTGLPQISNEREILMRYYDERMGEGFDYAYRFPGMNKVLQAAGRVIRTVSDVGVIVLLDDRFLSSDQRNLFPREWERRTVCTVETVEGHLREFWKNKG